MTVSRTHLEWAVALFEYLPTPPVPSSFHEYEALITEGLSHCDLKPNYMGVSGRRKLFKIGHSLHKKIMGSNFEGLTSLSLVVNPPESDAPAFDRIVDSAFGWIQSNELHLHITAHEEAIPFLSARFWELLEPMFTWRQWSFGFGLLDVASRNPQLYVMGTSDGKLSREEEEALDRWYSTSPEVRQVKLREVFPLNILNERQLGQLVSSDQTLGDFIYNSAGTRTRLMGGLLVWEIPDDLLPRIRNELRGTDALIS
jgi:hypothetical protein